jgi:DNA-binding NarL/FixJ family response regulator
VGAGLVADAVAALQVGDAAGARVAFHRAASTYGLTGAVLEGLASASFVLLEFPRAIDEMGQAYAAYRRAGDGADAARVARMLGGMVGSTTGDWAVAAGWIARAKSLLGEVPDSSERGWVALTEGMFAASRTEKDSRFAEAREVGRRFDDADLAFVSSAYLGASLVHGDHTDQGMALLDEALAAVLGGEVTSFVVIEEIFCQLFAACEHARDVERAEQWIRVGDEVATRRRLPAVSAYCRTHYGGILTAAGRWTEAETTLTEAVRLWNVSGRTLVGDALIRLAELRIRQGRFEEAGRILDGQWHDEAILPRAALYLARGQVAAAVDLLGRAAQKADTDNSACIPVLGLLVEAQLACGQDARATADLLVACARAHPTRYAVAMAAQAEARVGSGNPVQQLWEAIDGFRASRLPWEESVCRLDLARALATTQPALAVIQARQALHDFEQLTAEFQADAARALLRQLGETVPPPRTAGQLLTRREAEVLRMLGEGLSNPEIAERLFISRKTVEHHVGNILAKLGLRNRAEAAGYAIRHPPTRPGEK